MLRKPIKNLAPFATAGLIGLFAGVATFVGASELTAAQGTEQADRVVDEAALGSELAAADDLRALLRDLPKEARGTDKEANLLYKLGDILQQGALMQFRVGNGPTKAQPDLKRYHALMSESANVLGKLARKFPHFDDAAHATFMLAKAQEEIGKFHDAEKSYQSVVSKFPSAAEVIPSQMALAGIAVKQEKHALALRYLREVEKHPESPHYPFALFQSAWSHYLLGQPETAVSYAKKLADYYGSRPLTNSDRALRENLLQDSATFYYAAYDRNPKQYSLAGALDTFRKLDQGAALSKMTLQFSNLLRVNDRPQALRSWNLMVLATEKGRPEAIDVTTNTFEYQLNNKDYPALTETGKELAAVASKQDKKSDARIHAEKLLFEAASQLESRLQEYHQGPEFEKTAAELASIYSSSEVLVTEKDPRIRTLESNLAEILFSTRQYAKAADHYRWIVEHGSWSDPAIREASRKAISARYESLKARGLVPSELKAVAFSKDQKQDAEARGLIDWIDEHVSKTGELVDDFQFEANRVLYANHGMHEAVERLERFARKHPGSKLAVSSATLAVDTWIASSDWEDLEAHALSLARVKGWAATGFSARMQKTAAEAKLKRAEALVASRNGNDALKQYEEFVKSYPKDSNVTVALAHAANTAIALKDRDRAAGYMAELARVTSDRKQAGKTLLALAKLEEDRYGFAAAARNYTSALLLPKASLGLNEGARNDIRHRVLLYSWLSDDAKLIQASLRNGAVCTHALRSDCDRIATLSVLTLNSPSVKESRKALALSTRSAPPLRAIWATVALENTPNLSSSERNAAIHVLARSWKQADALTRLTLLPRISKLIPGVYALERERIRESGALKADAGSIHRRVKLIAELEKNALDAALLPWSEIRAQILSEVGQTYADLSTGLKSLPLPKGLRSEEVPQYRRMIGVLAQPYEMKARRLELLAASLEPRNAGTLQLAALREAEPKASWSSGSSVDDNSADTASILRAKWARALRDGRWHQVAFFMQDAEEKSLLPGKVGTLAKAVSLSLAGAPNEGSKLLSGYCRAASGRASVCKGRI